MQNKLEPAQNRYKYHLPEVYVEWPPLVFGTEMISNKPVPLDVFQVTYLHYHRHLELGYCVRGSCLSYVGDKTETCQAGDITIVLPFQRHITCNATEDFSLWRWVYFDLVSLCTQGGIGDIATLEDIIQNEIGLYGVLDQQKYPQIIEQAKRVLDDAFPQKARRHEGGNVVPGIAETYDVSDDGLTYTFHLRDTQWSDGVPVTAGDFAYSWLRTLTPATGSSQVESFNSIKGAIAYYSGESTDPATVGISATDDKTLVVTLEAADPFFIESMARGINFYPIRKDYVEKFGADYASSPDKFIGCGPFTLTEWVQTASLTMRNQLRTLKNALPQATYRIAAERLERQVGNAREWRDVLCDFFHRLSGVEDEKARL